MYSETDKACVDVGVTINKFTVLLENLSLLESCINENIVRLQSDSQNSLL